MKTFIDTDGRKYVQLFGYEWISTDNEYRFLHLRKYGHAGSPRIWVHEKNTDPSDPWTKGWTKVGQRERLHGI